MAAGLAVADLKTETLTRASILTGIGTTEVNSVNEHQGDKRAENQASKMAGGIGGAFAGKPRTTADVTRLDKSVSLDAVPETDFGIPDGYKKVKKQDPASAEVRSPKNEVRIKPE